MTPGHSDPPWEIPALSQSSVPCTSPGPEGGRQQAFAWVRFSPARPGLSSAPVRSQEQQAHWDAPFCSASPVPTVPTQLPCMPAVTRIALPWHPVFLIATLSLVVTVAWEGAGQPPSTKDSETREAGAPGHMVAVSELEPRASCPA